MPNNKNPFTPIFGSEPLFLAGREQIIEDILGGLENGPGDPNRISILTGPRGSGKTVLLTIIANEASKIGWVSASVTALPGMMEKILEQIEQNGKEFLPAKAKRRLTEIHAFGVGFSIENIEARKPSWRLQMTRYLELFSEYKIGILLTVDEIDVRQPEMVELVSDFQHFIREKLNIALIMAGLPGKTLQMFHDGSISFVRRAFQHNLEPIHMSDVKAAIQKTVESSGKKIETAALESAASFSEGFPFLIQLVGYHAWRQSGDKKNISLTDVGRGIESSEEYMNRMILDTTIRELSEGDRAFLIAMLPDEGESRMSDITNRLGISTNLAGQYRLRMIKQGIVEEYGRGRVQFAMPLLKKYLAKINPSVWNHPGSDNTEKYLTRANNLF